jgi:ribosome maturation protein SDO1
MTDTIARLRSQKLIFETMVDLDTAMKLRKGEEVDTNELVRDQNIYLDQKKGMIAGKDELETVFKSTDLHEVTKQIVKKGEVEVTQEFRDEATIKKRKQIVDFIVRNGIDAQSSRPFTPDTIDSALSQAGINVLNKPIDQQIPQILDSLKTILPIKIETKKLKITIPAIHTGKAYGLLQEYKENEEWLGNGDLQITLNIPIGIQMEFYDKLNGITHGSAITEEIKQEE